jgi:AraC-like DNA-binding protein
VRSAPTLRAAFDIALRYQDPRLDYIHTTLSERGPLAVIELAPAAGVTLHSVNVDYRLSRLITGSRTLAGDPHLAPHEIGFSYPRPSSLAPYHTRYGKQVRLVFDTERPRLVFAHDVLDTPSVYGDPVLHDLLLAQAEKLVERLRAQQTESVARRLHDVIASQLATGKPSTARAARKLGLSERTLRRRLADEGESFQSIVDTVRSAMAQVYLQDNRLSADGLAERLGFDSAASLRRAFRRWTGSSLREQRAQVAAR